ncbi:hypothetical protein FACS189468_3020 [Spirochaetia bacterium]|nr:hypothetical protein FACS189468_3020 [Spirochaetia bacterium]
MNWLIEGAGRWFRDGLVAPKVISSATEEYRGEMDVIGNFIKERCIQKPGASIRARELFKVYQGWCEENNEHACSERLLGLRLKELGIEQKRLGDGRYWRDIEVKADLS